MASLIISLESASAAEEDDMDGDMFGLRHMVENIPHADLDLAAGSSWLGRALLGRCRRLWWHFVLIY